ncbi:hypothetical protein [Humidesulfovibrio sp.]
MHTLDDATPPALFGFDLFQLLSFRFWPHGFTLAILPRWLLALEVIFTSQGRVVRGRVLGRGLFGELEKAGGCWPFFECGVDDQARFLFLGRLRLELDRKSRERSRAARKGIVLEG